MTSPRDQVDDWLARDVTPLNPPPGSLNRIRHRARQRKTRQLTIAVAGCAVVLAAAVVAPQVIAAGRSGHHVPVAIQSTAPSVQPSVSHSRHASGPQSSKATQMQQRTTLSNSWTVPPRHFQPTSVTFVGNGYDGVAGAVIGQAGTPGHCATPVCTSLAGTKDYGKTWYGVSAPLAPGPDGSAGVSQVRFANLSDGWAYGPALYETSVGGWPWHQELTYNQRVLDVEAAPAHVVNGVQVPARAFGVFGTCTGNGADYAAACTSFSLWTSVAGSRTWTTVTVPPAFRSMPSQSSAAPQLVISGNSTAYLLTPSGQVLSGPTSGAGWQLVGPAPCPPSPASAGTQTQTHTQTQTSAGGQTQAPASAGGQSQSPGAQGSGSPSPGAGSQSPGTPGAGSQYSGGQFAAGPKLLLACDSQAAGGRTQVIMYSSANGAGWQPAGRLTVRGRPTSLAAAGAQAEQGVTVLATTSGIEYSANGGRTWQVATFAGTGSGSAGAGGHGPPGGFSYIGMTTSKLGVAVPSPQSGLGAVYVTGDGGKSWQASSISSG